MGRLLERSGKVKIHIGRFWEMLRRTVWPWCEIWRLNNHLKLAKGINENLISRNNILAADLEICRDELAKRESLHEQGWLKEASMFSGVDFNVTQKRVYEHFTTFNGELQCARECYRRGMGYREFPEFLALYGGRDKASNLAQGGNFYGKR